MSQKKCTLANLKENCIDGFIVCFMSAEHDYSLSDFYPFYYEINKAIPKRIRKCDVAETKKRINDIINSTVETLKASNQFKAKLNHVVDYYFEEHGIFDFLFK